MSHYNNVTPARVQSKPLVAYPDSFKTFSTLNFKRCDVQGEPQAKKIVKEQLKVLLEKANAQGKLWTNDWERQTIPYFDPGAPLELVGDIDVVENLKKKRQMAPPEPVKMPPGPAKKQKKQKKNDDNAVFFSDERIKLRSQRFERELNAPAPVISYNEDNIKADKDNRLVGYCEDLEKRYLRLTSEPDPAKVRPQRVLEKSLEYVLDKYNADKKSKYNYVCDQLKSIRQDLKVQFIENDFTVKVYETHAKIAIENNDLPEFNQCQSCLGPLYRNPEIDAPNKDEFLSYKIFYLILTENLTEISKLKLLYLKTERPPPPVKGRMQVDQVLLKNTWKIFACILTNNYADFFSAYAKLRKINESKVHKTKLNTALKLMEGILTKFRVRTLRIMCQGYRKIPKLFLQETLAFRTPEELHNFLEQNKLTEFVSSSEESGMFEGFEARPTVIGIHDRMYRNSRFK